MAYISKNSIIELLENAILEYKYKYGTSVYINLRLLTYEIPEFDLFDSVYGKEFYNYLNKFVETYDNKISNSDIVYATKKQYLQLIIDQLIIPNSYDYNISLEDNLKKIKYINKYIPTVDSLEKFYGYDIKSIIFEMIDDKITKLD